MEECGFRIGPALSLTSETHVKPEVLYDKEGPFQQEWRSGDRYMFVYIQSLPSRSSEQTRASPTKFTINFHMVNSTLSVTKNKSFKNINSN